MLRALERAAVMCTLCVAGLGTPAVFLTSLAYCTGHYFVFSFEIILASVVAFLLAKTFWRVQKENIYRAGAEANGPASPKSSRAELPDAEPLTVGN